MIKRRVSLVAITAAVFASIALVTQASGAQAAQSVQTPATTTVRVATWNAQIGNKTSNVISGFKTIGKSADVIGLQEMSKDARRKALTKAVDHDYDSYQPGGGAKVPIFWKKAKYKMVRHGLDKAYSAEKVEFGAGSTNAPRKYNVWVKLEDRSTGATFYVINTHMIPTVESGGKPRANKPQRIRLYKKHMDELTKLADNLGKNGVPVYITGDFNVDYRKDAKHKSSAFPYVTMQKHGIQANWKALPAVKGGTHGSRLIDYVFTKNSPRSTIQSQKILGQSGSDHNAVVVTFQVKNWAAVQPAPIDPR